VFMRTTVHANRRGDARDHDVDDRDKMLWGRPRGDILWLVKTHG
jgi:hypothetical protein